MDILIKFRFYSLQALPLAGLLVILTLALFACGEKVQKATPVGDYAVLEQLANAYRSVGEQYPMQPQAMPPQGRREFIEKVFQQAGYSYSLSLLAVGQSTDSITHQDHRDLVDLLLLPNKGMSDESLPALYNAEEQVAVRHLRTVFR